MHLVTAEEMRRIDEIAITKFNIPSLTLMERAGAGAFEILKKRFPDIRQKKVLVIAGKGNNGGDGLVVARLLKGVAREVVVSLASSVRSDLLKDCDIIVDALFGTGLSREVTGDSGGLIEAINHSKKFVLSLDIPSGLSADTGRPLGVAVRANVTATMGLPKLGLVLATDGVGDLEVVDIGIPEEAIRGLGVKRHWITASDLRPFFGPRKKDSHKGSYGNLLLVGGSANKPGAILMAGRAALRTGAGLVTVALPDRAYRKFPKNFLELMYEPLPSSAGGTFHRKGLKKLEKIMEGKDAVAVGPGMGVTADTKSLVRCLFKSDQSLVLDADALNCLATLSPSPFMGEGLALSLSKGWGGGKKIVLTPHPGEMARLIGSTAKKVQNDRIGTASRFAVQYGVHVVLKGYRTIIATPKGDLYINSTGNPGMATAGMGDVLTGMIGSLIAQGLEFEKAIIVAVFLHGRAGDRVAARIGDRGLLASDLIEEIPQTIREIAF